MFDAVIFDVDNVVIDTDGANRLALSALGEGLEAVLERDMAARLFERFVAHYSLLRKQAKAEAGSCAEGFPALKRKIEKWQAGLREEGFETKMWCREVLLGIAAESCSLAVTPSLLEAAFQPYWTVLEEEMIIRPDAVAAINLLRSKGVHLHLATDSDGAMRYDEKRGAFRYDPDYARAKKLKRLASLQTIGISPEDISIGDPFGKPGPRFFKRVLAELSRKAGKPLNLNRVLAVGDDVKNDILPLFDLKVARGAWLRENNGGERPSFLKAYPGIVVVESLLDLEKNLWS